ncbi:MAG: Hsp20/alpha crystallin family protein [Panacagrimonas sp.]
MTKLAEQLKQGASQAWESLTEGWRELNARASSALTRFWPSAGSDNRAASEGNLPPSNRWAFMAADLFDGDEKLVVRIEAPGVWREDFRLEVNGDVLSVSGEKWFNRESGQGRYRAMQCAYGSFRRELVLPVAVKADQTRAHYEDGVLRIELPKVERSPTRRVEVRAG